MLGEARNTCYFEFIQTRCARTQTTFQGGEKFEMNRDMLQV